MGSGWAARRNLATPRPSMSMSASTTPAAKIEPSPRDPKRPLPKAGLAVVLALVVLVAGLAGGWVLPGEHGVKAALAALLFGAWIVGRGVAAVDVVRMRSRYVPATAGQAVLRFALGWA